MSILESMLYGFISGLTEFMPISSRGHQALFKEIFGIRGPVPILDILVRIAVLLAVIISSATYFRRFLQADSKSNRNGKKRSNREKTLINDFRLVKTGILPMIFVMLLHFIVKQIDVSLALVAIMFAINGIAVYIPEHLAHANKDSSNLSAFDSLVLGVASGLSVFPGVSGTGLSLSYAIGRGADTHKAYNWVLLFGVFSNIIFIVLEFIGMIIHGIGSVTFLTFIGYILAALFAFAAAMLSIYFMRRWILRNGCAAFGYYSWGAAMLSFILFLTA